MRRLAPLLLVTVTLAACTKPPTTPSPRQIRIVGGAAGYPFTTAVAERFMVEQSDAVAPLVQAGGDTPGIARFCGGLGARHPDLALIGRGMTDTERRRCAANGVAHVAAIPIGWSATVVASTRPPVVTTLTTAQLQAAIVAPRVAWSAISPRLSARPISIHGTVDAIGERRPPRYGAYRGHGADAALAADAAVTDRGSLALLPYATWWERRDRLAAIPLDGVRPDPGTIASGRYPARLPLILLVKSGEAKAVPGMTSLLHLFAAAIEPGGAFVDAGLIPLDPHRRADAIRALDGNAAAEL